MNKTTLEKPKTCIDFKEVKLKKNGKYQVVEKYGIITFPVSEEFDTIEAANEELKRLQLLL